jgi:hypothetical protein
LINKFPSVIFIRWYYVYVSVHPCCSTEIRNFDGSDSDRRIFLISLEQLRMNTILFSVKLYLTSLIFNLLRHFQSALLNNYLNGGFKFYLYICMIYVTLRAKTHVPLVIRRVAYGWCEFPFARYWNIYFRKTFLMSWIIVTSYHLYILISWTTDTQ